MDFNLANLSAADRYELLLSTVVPRPIALVTTLSEDGIANAAPYSLFNVLCHDPPIVAVSVLPHAERRMKDTAQNVLATGEFVVNLVSEGVAKAMNLTCIDAPPDINEIDLAKLSTTPSLHIKPPRIASCPAAFECRLITSLSFGPNQAILLAQVLHAYVANEFVIDEARCLIDTPGLNLIGGMHGAKWYTRTSDLFEMARPTWAEWTMAGKA